MLQIAIWGIAFVLVVKGLDILHQQRIAEAAGSGGGHRYWQLAQSL